MPHLPAPFPPPAEEAARLAALAALVDPEAGPGASDPELDDLVTCAALVCGTPISLVTLIGRQWQWFSANKGMEGEKGTSREIAFCAHAILQGDILEVPDAQLDPRFAENPVVLGDPYVRFYAGAPLITREGHKLGTLCVIDHTPRRLDPVQREVLHRLAHVAVRLMERRASGRAPAVEPPPAVATGTMPGRAAFEAELSRFCPGKPTVPGQAAPALLVIALDPFTLIEQVSGLAAEAAALDQLAALLSEASRGQGLVGRLDEDRFGLILPAAEPGQAEAVAKLICAQMAHYRFVDGERRFRLCASVGVVVLDATWLEPLAAIAAAQEAGLAAKEDGGDRYRLWAAEDEDLQLRRGEADWARRIEEAIDEDRFRLYVQALVTPDRSGPLRGEILLRLQEPDGRLVLPGHFMPSAERFDLVGALDRWVLSQTLRQLGRADLSGLAEVGMKVSGLSLADRGFHHFVFDALKAVGPDLRARLVFQITETAAIGNPVAAADFVQAMQGLGLRVILDNFGTGASTFGHLRSLRVDGVKIDGELVQNLDRDPMVAPTLRCFVEVARLLGLTTCAEWVDRPELEAPLAALGVDYLQGYHIARPVPLEDFVAQPAPRAMASR